ncbi:CPBP family intramembrane metalloprotease [bacterium]|nr:CPBP family intramembrane metalloprotease [bacterium]
MLLAVLTAPLVAAALLPAVCYLLGFLSWGEDGPPSTGRVFARLAVFSFILAVGLLHRRIGYAPALRAGLRWDARGRRQLAQGIALAFLPMLGLALAAVALGAWRWLPQALEKMARLPGYFASAVIISVLEEMLFRGVILSTLRRTWGVVAAVLVSALFFALLHPLGSPEDTPVRASWSALAAIFSGYLAAFAEPLVLRQIVGYFLVGVILAVATVRSGRLWYAVGLHFGWVFFIRADGLFLSRNPAWSSLYFGNNRLVDGVLIWFFLLLVLILVDRMSRKQSAMES